MRPLAISLANAALGIWALVFAVNSFLFARAVDRQPSSHPWAPWFRISRWLTTLIMSIVALAFLLLALHAFGARITLGSVGWLFIVPLAVAICLSAAEVLAGALTYVRGRRARTHGQGTSGDDVA